MRRNNNKRLYESIMKDVAKTVKRHLNEAVSDNIETFRNRLKKCGLVMEGPDSAGIAYISTNNMDDYDDCPTVCIEVYDDYWRCYLDDEENGSIWVSLDDNGEADEEIDTTEFEVSRNSEFGPGYKYSFKNAKLLADALLSF
jgi:hypothetical protein